MLVNTTAYKQILTHCQNTNTTLIAVSKTKPAEAIMELYNLGQRHFGENYVQELVSKQEALPKDIHWHFIGHLQSNKVKYIAPFIHLIHAVDSLKLYHEICKQAQKYNTIINCLLQAHIAKEETKFGFTINELNTINIQDQTKPEAPIVGLMGMASFTNNNQQLTEEFTSLHNCYNNLQQQKNNNFTSLSMGMSADYELAIKHGSNMIRVGSTLFGSR
jgi:PLP dependent protein